MCFHILGNCLNCLSRYAPEFKNLLLDPISLFSFLCYDHDKARRVLRAKGHFIFTVESVASEECLAGREFRLLKSGRFGHSRQYIDALATRHGFNVTV